MAAETVNKRPIYAFANTGFTQGANVGSARAGVNAALVLTDGSHDRVICVNSDFLRAWQEADLEKANTIFKQVNSADARQRVGLSPLPVNREKAWRQQNPFADVPGMQPVYVRLGWGVHAAPADHFFAAFNQKPLTIILRNESPTSTHSYLDTGGKLLPLTKPDAPIDDSLSRDYGEHTSLSVMSFGLTGSHIPPRYGDTDNHLLSAMPSAPVNMTRNQAYVALRDQFGVTLDATKKNVVVFVGDPKPVGGIYYPIEDTLKQLRSLRSKQRRNILLTTSHRTCGSHIVEIQDWQNGKRPFEFVNIFEHGKPNPRDALMALADFCVTTSESLSMVAELRATGKPVAVFGKPYESVGRQIKSGEIEYFCGEYSVWPRVVPESLPAARFKTAVLNKLDSPA